MKKSEVIDRLILELMDIVEEKYIEEKGYRWTAELLISFIEEQGMLPPYSPIGSEPLEGHIQYCQWEPEETFADKATLTINGQVIGEVTNVQIQYDPPGQCYKFCSSDSVDCTCGGDDENR